MNFRYEFYLILFFIVFFFGFFDTSNNASLLRERKPSKNCQQEQRAPSNQKLKQTRQSKTTHSGLPIVPLNVATLKRAEEQRD
jgi:hypothetical protein